MIGSYSSLGARRRRRRIWWSVSRFLFGLGPVAAIGGYGYQVGVAANQAWTDKLETDLQRLQQDNIILRDDLAVTMLNASSARTALENLQERYEAEVPDGSRGWSSRSMVSCRPASSRSSWPF